MSFIDTRLNSRYRFGFVGGPEWRTQVVQLLNGRTRRNANWADAHHRYTADFATLSDAEQEALAQTFMACRGQLYAFRFKDWNDWQATGQSLGTGDGTSTARQIQKHYVFGSQTYSRDITLPYDVTVYANGVEIAVTVDPLTGLATPTSPWPSGQAITADFKFDTRVRFAADFNPFTAAAQTIREVTVELVEDHA